MLFRALRIQVKRCLFSGDIVILRYPNREAAGLLKQLTVPLAAVTGS